VNDPRNQSQYQVRFDWGIAGAAAITPGAHLLIWADALVTAGAPTPVAADAASAVILGSVGNRTAVAQWVLDRQAELGDRVVVAVVAVGTDEGHFAVEDLLAAGAIIEAISNAGIDSTSPEAAAAIGAYAGLRNATGHVLSASVTGKQLAASGDLERLDAARAAHASGELRILKEFRFGA
jgi:2-phosphosulfolactate phosphatase